MPLINNKEVLYPKLSYQLAGIFFKVHNELGRFCREKRYCDVFEQKLKEIGLSYEREKKITFDSSNMIERVDFCIDNAILVDFKAKPFILKEDYYQMQRYLRALNNDSA